MMRYDETKQQVKAEISTIVYQYVTSIYYTHIYTVYTIYT